METTSYKLNIPLNESLRGLCHFLNDKGIKVYLVGEDVRDYLIHHFFFTPTGPFKFELKTESSPGMVLSTLQSKEAESLGFSPRLKSKSYSSILVKTKYETYEISPCYSQVGNDGNMDYVIFSDIKDDMLRRDVTINSLYYDIETGTVYDVCGGIQDIQKKRIRHNKEIFDYWAHNPIHILKFIRLFYRFFPNGSMYACKREITQALEINVHLLDDLPAEEKRDEFILGIAEAVSPKLYISGLTLTGAIKYIFPFRTNPIPPNTKDICIALAVLCTDVYTSTKHKSDFIKHLLIDLLWPKSIVDRVEFLMKFAKKVEEDLHPNFVELVKQRDDLKSRFTPDLINYELVTFGTMTGLSFEMINKFLKYNLGVDTSCLPKNGNPKEFENRVNTMEFARFRMGDNNET